jgi:hypothetical protein
VYKSRKSRKEHDQAIRKSSIQSIGLDPLPLHGIATIAAVDRTEALDLRERLASAVWYLEVCRIMFWQWVIPVESFVE